MVSCSVCLLPLVKMSASVHPRLCRMTRDDAGDPRPTIFKTSYLVLKELLIQVAMRLLECFLILDKLSSRACLALTFMIITIKQERKSTARVRERQILLHAHVLY